MRGGGVGYTDSLSQHNIFDSEKLSQICLVLLTQARFEPPVALALESDAAVATEPIQASLEVVRTTSLTDTLHTDDVGHDVCALAACTENKSQQLTDHVSVDPKTRWRQRQ